MAAERAVAMQSRIPTQSCRRAGRPSGAYAASTAPRIANGRANSVWLNLTSSK